MRWFHTCTWFVSAELLGVAVFHHVIYKYILLYDSANVNSKINSKGSNTFHMDIFSTNALRVFMKNNIP